MKGMEVGGPEMTTVQEAPGADPKLAARFTRELELVRQPVFDLRAGEISHHELLLRVRVRGGLESPAKYLTDLKRAGESAALDAWVVERAASLIRPDESGRPQFEVNLSSEGALDPELSDHVTNLLAARGASAGALIVEIDDTGVDEAGMAHFRRRLFKLGHHFTLDEFERSGLNTLTRLRSLPFDFIKVDGEFVRGVAANPDDQAIVRRIAEIVRNVGRRTVAMHVQDEATVGVLRELGVDLGQGFFLGLPERLPDNG